MYSTTATAPLLTVYVRAGSQANTTGTILLGATSSQALAPSLSTTAVTGYWELQGDVVLTAISAAAADSTIRGMGYLMFGGGTASTTVATSYIWPAWGGGVSPGTSAIFDTSVTNYINVNAICGTSNANNVISLSELLVWGLN